MMNSEKYLKNNMGFSLTEVMVSAMVTVVIALGVYQGLQLFQSSSKTIEKSSSSLAETQQSGSYFTQVIESASMAYRIQHLPIPFSSCETTGPCVRQVIDNKLQALSASDVGLLSSLKAGNTRIRSLEFFRDASGELYTQSGAIDIRNSPPVVLPTQMVSSNYYNTWPLYSEQSKPFVIVKQKEGFSGYFSQSKNCQGTTIATSYTVFAANIGSNSSTTGAPSVDTLKSLSNTLVLVYNSRHPDLYTVQMISETPKLCIPDPKNLSNVIPECTCAKSDQKLNNIAINLSEVRNFQLYSPTLIPSPSTWGNQSIYAFPTSHFSIQARTNDNRFNDLLPPADIRKFGHFFDSFSPDSISSPYSSDEVYMIPISVVRYSLAKSDPTQKDSPYHLVVKTYSGRDTSDPETIVAGSLRSQIATPTESASPASISSNPSPSPSASASAGPTENIPAAVFIRKLGTTEMGIILNKSK